MLEKERKAPIFYSNPPKYNISFRTIHYHQIQNEMACFGAPKSHDFIALVTLFKINCWSLCVKLRLLAGLTKTNCRIASQNKWPKMGDIVMPANLA